MVADERWSGFPLFQDWQKFPDFSSIFHLIYSFEVYF